jgi:hypothetical protein
MIMPQKGDNMALVKNVEKRIWDVEEFDIIIKHSDGKDMRGDKHGIPMYDKSRMAKGTLTVSAWKDQRFHPAYSGLEVDVLDGLGQPVKGNTLLSSVRKSYED